MSPAPLLSFIVLSYDYAEYIGIAIRSILDQTVQDFEIVVVDDASHDASVEVVRSFVDSRIRLLVNDRNLGGAASYNRAVEAARGEWLVNVDADDWIAPHKAEVQLAAVAADPALDIIGSWVAIVDAEGQPHPRAPELEADIDRSHDFGRVDTWIGANLLCRSSTMVRRTAHLRIGLDDPTMVYAPDYELWTRALRGGCRFGLVPERLTYYRLQPRGVSYNDPVGTLLEMSYAMLRNLVPLAEARALLPSYVRMVDWLTRNARLSALRPDEAHRLVGMMMLTPALSDYASFRAALAAHDADPTLAAAGRRCLALAARAAHPQAADRSWFWWQQSEAWEVAHSTLMERLAAILEASDTEEASRVG